MSGKPPLTRLPLRRILKESLYTGCSKDLNHRTLPKFQQFELPHKFPRFPQIFGEWIVRRIRNGETGAVKGHPCLQLWDQFLDCTRHHPNSYETKCKGEAGKCLICFEQHKDWKEPEKYNYMRLLEHFRIFSEGRQSIDEGVGKFRYKKILPRYQGTGTVLRFDGYPEKPRAKGGGDQ